MYVSQYGGIHLHYSSLIRNLSVAGLCAYGLLRTPHIHNYTAGFDLIILFIRMASTLLRIH